MLTSIRITGFESMTTVGSDGSMAQGFVVVTEPISLALLPQDGDPWTQVAKNAAHALTRLLPL